MENKRTLKKLYRTYVKEWKQDHSEPEFQGMEPACFEEWLDNEYPCPWTGIELAAIEESKSLRKRFMEDFKALLFDLGETFIGKPTFENVFWLFKLRGAWAGCAYRIHYDSRDGFTYEER